MNHLRNFIKEQILLLKEEGQVSAGKDVKDTSSSKNATNKLASNPALLSAIEAILSGIPVLLSNIPAHQELKSLIPEIILFDIDDPESFYSGYL